MPVPNILRKIIAQKKIEVANHKQQISENELHRQTQNTQPSISFSQALRQKGLSVIAEIKKASPSAGVIRENFDPLAIAKSYVNAGAHAISMLTDEEFFQGSLAYISQVRPFVPIPILRKDFMIDPYQLLEARAVGADAILLIVAALEKSHLRELYEATYELGLETLVETHSASEMEIALEIGAKIVGVNNRNLETFEIDLKTTEQLTKMVPDDTLLVGESGLHSKEDLQRMVTAGVDAVLVGTHFMKHPDPGTALKDFLTG